MTLDRNEEMKTTSERKLYKYCPNIKYLLSQQLPEAFPPHHLPPGMTEEVSRLLQEKQLRLWFHTAGLLKERAVSLYSLSVFNELVCLQSVKREVQNVPVKLY